MVLISDDEKKMIDTGTSDTLRALYSTAYVLLKDKSKEIQLGLNFLKTGNCAAESANETVKQIQEIQKALSLYKPDKAIYDYRDLKLEAPWKNNISDDITSCADLFTTADGKDLLFEIMDMLRYASAHNVSIEALG